MEKARDPLAANTPLPDQHVVNDESGLYRWN